MEHRWGRRIVVDVPIQMAAVGNSLKSALLANLSVTGALIKADFRFRAPPRVRIVFVSSVQPQQEALSLAAYVARHNRHGIGVEWCELASPAVTALLRALTATSTRGERKLDRASSYEDAQVDSPDNRTPAMDG